MPLLNIITTYWKRKCIVSLLFFSSLTYFFLISGQSDTVLSQAVRHHIRLFIITDSDSYSGGYSRSKYSHSRFAHCLDCFYNFYIPVPFNFIYSESSPSLFPGLGMANEGSRWIRGIQRISLLVVTSDWCRLLWAWSSGNMNRLENCL